MTARRDQPGVVKQAREQHSNIILHHRSCCTLLMLSTDMKQWSAGKEGKQSGIPMDGLVAHLQGLLDDIQVGAQEGMHVQAQAQLSVEHTLPNCHSLGTCRPHCMHKLPHSVTSTSWMSSLTKS